MPLTDTEANTISFAEIRKDLNGNKSLHATVKFLPGQLVSKFGAGKTLNAPNYLTVQVAEDQHIMLNPDFLQYINHSCNPNVEFDPSNGTVTAIRTIPVGEEFSFFYPSTEWSMAQGFDCLCQSDNCLSYIQGAAHLPQDVLANYTFSEYIQKRMQR